MLAFILLKKPAHQLYQGSDRLELSATEDGSIYYDTFAPLEAYKGNYVRFVKDGLKRKYPGKCFGRVRLIDVQNNNRLMSRAYEVEEK